MSRRLDYNKAFRNEQARYGLNVKDEAEWMENDAAGRCGKKCAPRIAKTGLSSVA